MGGLPRSPPFLFKLQTMALYYDLPVFKDELLIYSLTNDFSKEEKRSFERKRGSDFLLI
jgi:hypothetical protein